MDITSYRRRRLLLTLEFLDLVLGSVREVGAGHVTLGEGFELAQRRVRRRLLEVLGVGVQPARYDRPERSVTNSIDTNHYLQLSWITVSRFCYQLRVLISYQSFINQIFIIVLSQSEEICFVFYKDLIIIFSSDVFLLSFLLIATSLGLPQVK